MDAPSKFGIFAMEWNVMDFVVECATADAGFAEAKLAEMAVEMAANSACDLAQIAEAKPAEMSVEMVAARAAT